MKTTTKLKIQWKKIRACDPEYFKKLDDEFEKEHRFLFAEAKELLLKWFRSQPRDKITNRQMMEKNLSRKFYMAILETIIDEE